MLPILEPEAIDPADCDTARRLVVALERRGIVLDEDQALDVARELSGVDPYFP